MEWIPSSPYIIPNNRLHNPFPHSLLSTRQTVKGLGLGPRHPEHRSPVSVARVFLWPSHFEQGFGAYDNVGKGPQRKNIAQHSRHLLFGLMCLNRFGLNPTQKNREASTTPTP